MSPELQSFIIHSQQFLVERVHLLSPRGKTRILFWHVWTTILVLHCITCACCVLKRSALRKCTGILTQSIRALVFWRSQYVHWYFDEVNTRTGILTQSIRALVFWRNIYVHWYFDAVCRCTGILTHTVVCTCAGIMTWYTRLLLFGRVPCYTRLLAFWRGTYVHWYFMLTVLHTCTGILTRHIRILVFWRVSCYMRLLVIWRGVYVSALM